jgi:6-phosphofructokinase 1
MLGSSNRTNPYRYEDTESGRAIDASGQAEETIKQLGLDGLIVIGGDGTLTLANRFAAQCGIPIIGIPKTIDNDVHGTDFAIGFDSAVSYVTEAVDRLHTTAESHHRVMLLETMGRTTGWIALYAGIAGGADAILIPERQFEVSGIIETIQGRSSAGHLFTIVVVAEGVPAPDGAAVYRSQSGPEHRWKLGGVCAALEVALARYTNQEIRSIVLGHLQRGGPPTAFDRTLATQLGTHAVRLLVEGQSSRVVGLRGTQVHSGPLVDVAEGARTVPTDHSLLQAAVEMGIYVG